MSLSKIKIAVEPAAPTKPQLERAVVEGGGTLASIEDAEALVWTSYYEPDLLPDFLQRGSKIRWVALPFTGIDLYRTHLDDVREWTCARGVYARPVAEHAIAMGLAGHRGLIGYAQQDTWSGHVGSNLVDGNVVIFGGGGIAEELLTQLSGFGCHTTVVRRASTPMAGADVTVTTEHRLDVLPTADLVILALSLTPETEHIIGSRELEAMASHAWLVNVARGKHVDIDALLVALKEDQIGGACLDVTEPEPLPDGHELWDFPNVLITPHVANTAEMGEPLLAAHIAENVRRFGAGLPLIGTVDRSVGY